MTLRAFLLHFPPVPASPTLALIILCLALVFTVSVVLLVALGFEHRARLGEIQRDQKRNARRVEERLGQDRACVLRDVTHGAPKQESDVPASDDFA